MPPKITRVRQQRQLPEPRKTLACRITTSYAKSQFDETEKPFLPAGCLDFLVTEKSVVEELNDKQLTSIEVQQILADSKSEINEAVRFSLKAKKVFATTVVSGFLGADLHEVLWGFIENEIDDERLPMKEDFVKSDTKCFNEYWNVLKRDHFFHAQWKFLAPVFSRQQPTARLEPDHILPFIYKGLSISEGASGKVYEVHIHKDHHPEAERDAAGNIPKLAIKEFVIPTGNQQLREDALKVWGDEINTLDRFRGMSHENLIEKIAAIKRGQQHCLMLLWAEGGNLREFWQSFPPVMSVTLVKDIISQLRGMAEVLEQLHSPEMNCRHGDIKPENILRFPGPDKSRIGLFKISDLGSAKHHAVVTRLRNKTAGSKWATKVYEPPESMTNKLGATPRLYDIWSMGCVTLEWMVWLLYGNLELTAFNNRMKDSMGDSEPFFLIEEVEERGEGGSITKFMAHIHPAVQGCFQDMASDSECKNDSALCALLEIVINKLLVVELPSENELSGIFSLKIQDSEDQKTRIGGARATAKEFVQALDAILKHENAFKDSYWFTGRSRDGARLGTVIEVPKPVSDNSLLLSPGWKPIAGQTPTVRRPNESASNLSPGNLLKVKTGPIQDIQDVIPPSNATFADYLTNAKNALSNEWSYPVDNGFATQFLEDTHTSIEPSASRPARLCEKCKTMDFWSTRFRIRDLYTELEVNSKSCDFCKLRWDVSKHLDHRDFPFISFERNDSMFLMNDDSSPVFTIYRTKELNTRIPIQIGYPQLPEPGTPHYFRILRQWLHNCDANHEKLGCKPAKSEFLPTRLLDVGQVEATTIHLYETQAMDSLEYIALSHPWGNKPPFFCTYPNNVEEYKKGIDVATLPSTFKDAVRTTQQLGFRYLWIDSICIIQGPDGDFEQEAGHMELVFSSAYCVLAASSAAGQSDGFLSERDARDFVTFQHKGQSPFYICRFIDDFNKHVLQGKLSKRGWVMQERVLAHRTIYFTSKQTYWECGEAVRCETLTKMENKLASFLGDPKFPSKITDKLTSKGQRIIFYQDMYKQYSRLSFTRWEDRPIAIAGLEKRLLDDLRTRGGFGIFDDGQSLLRRSLMWQRGKDEYGKLEEPMRRIEFSQERKIRVPSWSWMAYEGKIDFLEMRLGGVTWQEHNIWSPWDEDRPGHAADVAPGEIILTAIARNFDVNGVGVNVIHDHPMTEGLPLKCIAIGRRKGTGRVEDTIHYALFITKKDHEHELYERVGVGLMYGRSIDLAGPGMLVKVC